MVGFGDGLLHFIELLREDVGPGIFLAIHHAGLQRLVDLRKGHLLRVGTQRAELRFQHVGALDAELQALDVFGALELVLVGRQLLHAVVPVGQAEQAAVGHGLQQGLTVGAGLEAVDRLHVVEQERQVEQLDLLGVAVELGQRRRDHLHVAEQQRFHFLAVTEQLGVGEHLHLNLARQLLLGELLELDGGLALRCLVSHHVAELDHDGRLGQRTERQRHQARQRQCGQQRTTAQFGNLVHGFTPKDKRENSALHTASGAPPDRGQRADSGQLRARGQREKPCDRNHSAPHPARP